MFTFMIQLNFLDVPNKLEEMHKKYKGSYRGWFGPKLAYIVQSPEELAVIMNSPKCLEKDDVYKIFSVLLQNGLVTAPGLTRKTFKKPFYVKKSFFS